MTLLAEEQAVLDLERTWWTVPGATSKREAIRAQLEMSVSRYYAVLERLIDSPDAFAYDPLVVRRVRRRVIARRRAQVVGDAPRRHHPR